jgi:hypothetical protein
MTTEINQYTAEQMSRFELMADEVQAATGHLGADGNPDEILSAHIVGGLFSNEERFKSAGQLSAVTHRPEFPTGVSMHLYIYREVGGKGYSFNVVDLLATIRYQQSCLTRLIEAVGKL